ncbi:hypothetical protein [Streptomyces sp. NBC_01508]|uniref:hypothetical protein n=1 Tax=Streptomyces sp. NBC_01508 TaxID=2903888 RepID=UPI00386D9B8A
MLDEQCVDRGERRLCDGLVGGRARTCSLHRDAEPVAGPYEGVGDEHLAAVDDDAVRHDHRFRRSLFYPFEVAYADRGGSEFRRSLADAWAVRFGGVAPVRAFKSYKGQRHLPGLPVARGITRHHP